MEGCLKNEQRFCGGIYHLREPGTYQDPCRMAEGMDTVLVAGVPVIDGGVYTGALAGRIVRR